MVRFFYSGSRSFMNCADKRLLGFLIALSLTIPLHALSQTPTLPSLDPSKLLTQYGLEVWRSDQGLPQNSVNAILQTHDGYLWFGTQEGLVKFNGVDFMVFDKRNTPELRSNYIWSLYEDSHNSLWVGTNGGGVSRLSNGAWTTFTTEQGLASDVVAALLEDAAGSMWMGTAGGLCRLVHRDSTGSSDVFTTYRRDPDSLKNGVFGILQDHNGIMWVNIRNQLCVFKDGEFIPLSPNASAIDSNISAMKEDKNGDLWIGSNGMGGVWRLKNGTWKHFGSKEGMSKSVILSILPDKDGCIWIGTGGDGLYRFSKGKFDHLSVQQGLSDGFVRSLYEDGEGSLWIGTYRGGVNRMKDGTFTVYTHSEGLSNDFVLSVCGDKKNNIWIGTYGSGLNLLSKNKITSFTKRNGMAGNVITSLCCDKNNDVWIGTFGDGLSLFRNGRFRNFKSHTKGRNSFIISLFSDRKGRLWIGTEGGGLEMYQNDEFTTYTTQEGLSNNVVTSMCGSADGSMWIGTAGGLSRIRDGALTAYHKSDGLSSEYVLSVFEDDEQTLWIGTDGGGLNRFKNGKFTVYTTKEGLFDDVAFTILDDDNGFLWMSSNKGVYRVSKQQLNQLADGTATAISCNSYGKSDGMGSSECNGRRQPSAWKGKDGMMWFATINGVSVVDPHNLKLNSLAPPIVIEKIKIDDAPAKFDEGIDVKPGADRLEVHYAGLSFVAPAKMHFKYKLMGYDKDWIDAQSRRVAYYNRLSPGSYTFEVLGSNNDGVWNLSGASLRVSIEPYFYQTYVFYGVCALITIALVIGGYRIRVAQIQRNARELSHLVDERTQKLLEEKKRTEDALAELARGEARYEHLVEHANDVIYRTDQAGRFTFINQMAIKMSGYSEAEFMQKNFRDFVHPAHHKRVQYFYYKQVMEKIPTTYFEFPALDRFGKLYWIGQNVQLILEHGEIVGTQAVARDITQRKAAEDALHESRRFIQRIADATPTIMFLFDIIDNKVLYVNNELKTILGYTPEELQRMGPAVIQTVLHPDDFSNFASILSPIEIAKDGDITELELRLRRADGEWCWAYLRANVFTRSADGRAKQILGSALDITPRKRHEEAIRQSEDKYRRLFEESKDVVFISTLEGKLLDVNPAGVELFGYSSKEGLLSRNIGTDFFAKPDDREPYMREILRHGFVKDYEITMKRRDGSTITILETSNAVRDERGAIVAIRGIMRDITERQQLIQQLIRAQKMESVGTLAGGVAHDFNNILALILTSAELLKAHAKESPALLRAANVISSSAHRGADIAKQLLLFARSEKGEQKAISLFDVVTEIRQLLEHSMPGNITIETEIDRGNDVILGDSGHLHQVVTNLALNARDAMPDGGRLTIRVTKIPHEVVREQFGGEVAPIAYVELSVSDTGAGMDEATKQRLFDPFFTTKERGKGTGLGLSIVHGIVRSYHGFVHVQSEPAKGTTFKLYFPALSFPEDIPPITTEEHNERH